MSKNYLMRAYCLHPLQNFIKYKCSTKKISNIIEELSDKLTSKQLFKNVV